MDGAAGERLVEPERAPTVRDVLTHTAGLGYGFDPEDPVDKRYAESMLTADFRNQMTLEEMSRRLGDLPLRFHPGSHWRYSFGTDVCARLVEVMSGRRFGDYLREVIFDPLGMPDTGFVVPESGRERFAANYYRSADKELVLFDDPATSRYLEPRPMQSGGGGLVSTTPDYLRFLEMLRRGGELDGARILGPSTIRYMASNHLPGGASLSSLALGTLGQEPYAGIGFGLGFAVTLDPVELQTIASPGDYYWGGAAATLFWIDPVEDMLVIFMVQHMGSPYNFRGQLQQLVHQAIVS
jgi:CubicO group peptidase (beta-lactamase class C family)